MDDFLILDRDKETLERFRERINQYLIDNLKIELHPDKSRVIPLRNGITFLGFRVFYYYKLLKRSNQTRIEKRISRFREKLRIGEITREHVKNSIAGWDGYARMADTYRLRQRVRGVSIPS